MDGINNWTTDAVDRAYKTWGKKLPEWSTYAFENAADGQYLMDLGCGFGRFYRYLKESGRNTSEYIGLDSSWAMIDKARDSFPDGCFKFHNLLTPFFSACKPYNILCNAVLIHLPDIDQGVLMNQLYRFSHPRKPKKIVFDINCKPKVELKLLRLGKETFYMNWQNAERFEEFLERFFIGYDIKSKEFSLGGQRIKKVFVLEMIDEA